MRWERIDYLKGFAIFTVLGNHYFNQKFPLLDDITYFSNLKETPYNFTAVLKEGEYIGPFPDNTKTSTPQKQNFLRKNGNIFQKNLLISDSTANDNILIND